MNGVTEIGTFWYTKDENDVLQKESVSLKFIFPNFRLYNLPQGKIDIDKLKNTGIVNIERVKYIKEIIVLVKV